MVEEKPNREAMYNEVNFVPLKEDVIIVKFRSMEDKYMDHQTAINVGNAIGELVAIGWKDRNGVRRVVKFVGKDRIKIICALRYDRLPTFYYYCGLIGHTLKKCKSKDRDSDFNDKEESKIDSQDDSGHMEYKRKAKDCKEDSVSNSLLEKRPNKSTGSNGDTIDECPLKIAKRRLMENISPIKAMAGNQPRQEQLLVANGPDITFLCETKTHTNKMASIRSKCRIEGCLAVNAIGQSGRLALMWKDGIKVEIKNYSNNHIDSCVGDKIRDKWIIGGDFNATLDNAEQEGGRRKPNALIDDFCAIVDNLSLVDLKLIMVGLPGEGNSFVKRDLIGFSCSLVMWRASRLWRPRLFTSLPLTIMLFYWTQRVVSRKSRVQTLG
ncbi:hypothetical protein CXB51_017174 [Gossypium anomalum]|uniref:Zinc knuckle CX2CX4HX4C domain-containing protein n=1 Tax=Gossypium anomalum TaxID=47600 RepID=A0A8J5ZIP2_9ROSI|nr:hypothetical protein CXB51_017174 [Gossypium anomalum]